MRPHRGMGTNCLTNPPFLQRSRRSTVVWWCWRGRVSSWSAALCSWSACPAGPSWWPPSRCSALAWPGTPAQTTRCRWSSGPCRWSPPACPVLGRAWLQRSSSCVHCCRLGNTTPQYTRSQSHNHMQCSPQHIRPISFHISYAREYIRHNIQDDHNLTITCSVFPSISGQYLFISPTLSKLGPNALRKKLAERCNAKNTLSAKVLPWITSCQELVSMCSNYPIGKQKKTRARALPIIPHAIGEPLLKRSSSYSHSFTDCNYSACCLVYKRRR